jgi:hypothetical protein
LTLALQLGDDHDGEHDLVLGEAEERAWIGEEHAGVQDIGPAVRTDGAGR